jgi:hypothetical protein
MAYAGVFVAPSGAGRAWTSSTLDLVRLTKHLLRAYLPNGGPDDLGRLKEAEPTRAGRPPISDKSYLIYRF